VTDFLTYCKLNEILIDHLPPLGVWRRYPTVDHPSKRNGAVKFMGDHGFVQNWATNLEVTVWKSDKPNDFDQSKLMRDIKAAEDKKRKLQREAAGKAAWILKQCQYAHHKYLKAKGYDDEQVNVWPHDGVQTMVVPMRVDGHLVGVQLIDEAGVKKFLFGQRTSGATFIFDNKGPNVLCEGYATALSVRQIMKSLKMRYTIHVCFSAGNLKKIAQDIGEGFVIADNDKSKTGERVAIETGLPYWMSDTEGEDFNDFHRRVGIFKASMSLRAALMKKAVAM
jgi:putative DNA primase/helicase